MQAPQHRANRIQWLKQHYDALMRATEPYARAELLRVPRAKFDHMSLEARDILHAAILRILKRESDEELSFDECVASIKTYVRFICLETARKRRHRNRFLDRGLDGNAQD